LAEVNSSEEHLPFVRVRNWWVIVPTEILHGEIIDCQSVPHDE